MNGNKIVSSPNTFYQENHLQYLHSMSRYFSLFSLPRPGVALVQFEFQMNIVDCFNLMASLN